MCVHVVRTGRNLYWIWVILLIVPPLGAIVYFIAIVLPELMGGPTARRMGRPRATRSTRAANTASAKAAVGRRARRCRTA